MLKFICALECCC